VLRLTLLAPATVEAILNGRASAGPTLAEAIGGVSGGVEISAKPALRGMMVAIGAASGPLLVSAKPRATARPVPFRSGGDPRLVRGNFGKCG